MMKKRILIPILLSLSMFNLFGQSKNNSKETEFKFKESKTTACFVCNHVLDKKRPILYVTHDAEGDWQFLCGEDDHTEDNVKIISLMQAVELDKTTNELYEMPANVGAEREKVTEKWQPFRLSK
jgi:hypothetical protein